MIGLQLYTGQRIDVDAETGFSLKSSNPFFCVGVNELSHTQDFSVPATKKNNLIFNVDNSVIAEGWRRGRGCWLIYSAGEIDGRLFIKDYNKERYNLLFVWGEELDPNLSLPLDNIWEPAETLLMTTPKMKNIPNTFEWMNYSELYNDGTFTHGITMIPAVNLGWMMEEAANAAGYRIIINDDLPSNAPNSYNPHNYGVTLDSVNAGTDYSLVLSGWSAAAMPEALNYQFYDSLSNPVPDNAAGVQLSQKILYWLVPSWGQYFVFEAIRPITIVIPASNNVAVRVNSGGYPGTTDPFNEPWIHHNVRLELNAGEYFTIFYTLDYQYNGIYGSTPFNFKMSVIDSMTEAQVGDTIRLADNLPDMSLLDLIRNYCLITSSYYIIDGVSKKILIYNINDVVANRFSRGRVINIDTGCDILDVASLRRYIDGYSQNNIIRCDSADYVAEIMRFTAHYRVDNDLLDNDSEFGVIGFNEGNRTAAGEAVFQNVEIGENNNVSLRPKLSICYVNNDGGTSYHLGWVEENYGMHNSMGLITENSTSIIMTIRESLSEYLKRAAEDLYYYAGCAFIAKDSTWKDNATQMTLVKVDNAMALAFSPAPPEPEYEDLSFIQGTGTQYIDTLYYPDAETEVEYVCEQVGVLNYANAQTFFGVSDGVWSDNALSVSTYHYGSYGYGDSASTGWGCFTAQRNVEMSLKLNKNGFYKDGNLVRSNVGFIKTLNLRSLLFFAANYNSVTEFGQHKLKIARIRQNGVVVREYVPKRRISDGVVGLLELNGNICPLSGTNFFINAGSGDFLFG